MKSLPNNSRFPYISRAGYMGARVTILFCGRDRVGCAEYWRGTARSAHRLAVGLRSGDGQAAIIGRGGGSLSLSYAAAFGGGVVAPCGLRADLTRKRERQRERVVAAGRAHRLFHWLLLCVTLHVSHATLYILHLTHAWIYPFISPLCMISSMKACAGRDGCITERSYGRLYACIYSNATGETTNVYIYLYVNGISHEVHYCYRGYWPGGCDKSREWSVCFPLHQ